MNSNQIEPVWEKRWHPLLDEWVIIASQTSIRPWSGAIIESVDEELVEHYPDCYLCPGVKRVSGKINPDYKETFTFDNDFASFALYAPKIDREEEIFKADSALGICRVVCFDPKHNIVLAEMPQKEIEKVVRVWKEEFITISKNKLIKNILIFENKGKVIGVSNPHPHGQIYATGFVPRILLQEVSSSKQYFKESGKCIFCEILKTEKIENRRIIIENESFSAFVPYFARYSFEVNIFARRHFSKINEMTAKEITDLADILKKVLCKYDNLFNMIFPNILMMHNAPVNGDDHTNYYHFHIEFYPPLRSPDKLKYLAGFESGGGNIINPTDPDYAAELLKNASEVHFRER
jgi:UDPglucose--hexose-1-phosphate uridylyltransferase